MVVDRLVIKEGLESRLADSLETAARWSDGIIIVQELLDGSEGGVTERDHQFSLHFACPNGHMSLSEIEPRLFSFNSPFGACPACSGLGSTMEVDVDRLLASDTCSFLDGAVLPFSSNSSSWFMCQLKGLLEGEGYSLVNSFGDLPKFLKEQVLYGSKGKVKFSYENMKGQVQEFHTEYEGIVPMLKRRHSEASTDTMREELESFMSIKPCSTCKGARLKPEALTIRVGTKNIDEVTRLTIEECLTYFKGLELTERDAFIGAQILKEINERLGFLSNVGLGYLTLHRMAGTLSGGEAQRIRLATQIGSGLVGVLYILDEPSIGLHQRDNERLIHTLKNLRDLGNTLIIVEHDEDTMLAADYLVDIGPGAGEHGGQIVAQGTVEEVLAVEDSITAQYLSGRKYIPLPAERRKPNKKYLEIRGAKENNLQSINVKFPIGLFTVVTGVSGSGKSTLINEILFKAVSNALHRSHHKVGSHKEIKGLEHIDKVINIDQSPIGRTPRSNPATYTGVFDSIRELYSQTNEAKIRGYKAGRFSFNVKGGRCEACRGDGIIKIEMHFLPDVYVPCEVCKGARYNRETLEVKYKGKRISDVLDMVVDDAVEFFKAIPKIHRKLVTLQEVGLGYIRLGQPATTLSGGEAQRVKLATELARRSTGKTLYILDEPTTGLHVEDISKLLQVLQQLTDGGDTVVVIEHNLDVIKTADHIIDLGPEGGSGGGTLVGTGTPEEIAKISASYTGRFLGPVLEKTRTHMKQHDE